MPKLSELLPLVDQYASKYGVDPAVARAALFAENSGNDGVVDMNRDVSLSTKSSTGALGVSQVLPSSFANLKIKGIIPADTDFGTAAGQVEAMVGHLADAAKRNGGDPTKMLLDYQGGPKDVAAYTNAGGDIANLPEQARNYLSKAGAHISLSYSNSSYAPGALDNVIKAGKEYSDGSAKVLAAIQGINENFAGEASTAENAATAAGEAQAGSIRTKAKIAVQQQDARKNILMAMGVDEENADSRLMQLNQQAAVSQQEIQNLAPQLDQLRSVSIADDPIGWLKSQVQLIGVSQRFNSAATAFNRSTSMAATLQSLANNQISLQPGTNKESVLQQADQEASQALEEAKLRRFQVYAAGRNAQLAEYSTQMQMLNFQFSHANTMAKLMQDKITMREGTAKTEKEKIQLIGVNNYRDMLGLDGFTPEQFNAMPAKDRETWLASGSRKTLDIASTPGESLATLFDTGAYSQFRSKLSPQAVNFYDDLNRQAGKKAQTLFPLDPKKQDAQFQKEINDRFLGWKDQLKARDYSNLSGDNPWKMNGSIFASAPALKNNSIAAWAKALPGEGATLREKDILSFAISQLQAGKPLDSVTEDVRQFFYEGMKQQHVVYRLPLLGVDIRNGKSGQVEYPIDGNQFGIFDRFRDPRKANSSNMDLQLLNPASIQQFLILNTVAGMKQGGVKNVLDDIATNTAQGPGRIQQAQQAAGQ